MLSAVEEIETQLKIIHACEKGATGVYYGHRLIARLFFAGMVPALDEMHQHEKEHFALFGAFLATRGAKQRIPPVLWCAGGIIYGILIGLLGRNAIWVSTATIEGIVNKELDMASIFFKDKSIDIYHSVLTIQQDELQHQSIATRAAVFSGWVARFVSASAEQCAYLAKYIAARF